MNKLIKKFETGYGNLSENMYLTTEIIITIENINGRYDEWFCSENKSKMKAELIHPITEALIMLHKMFAADKNSFITKTHSKVSGELAMGYCNNGDLIVAEWSYVPEKKYCCVYNKLQRKVEYAFIVEDTDDKTKPYVLSETEPQGAVIWACIIQVLANIYSDFNKLFADFIETDINSTKEFNKYLFVLQDFIALKTGILTSAECAVDGGVTSSGAFKRLKAEQLEKKEYSPQTIICGTFSVFDKNEKAKKLHKTLSLENLQQKYAVNDKEHTPQGVPDLKGYVTPEWLEKVIKRILRCRGTKIQANNVFLFGASGSGKTTSAMALAQVLNVPFGSVTFNQETDIYSISSSLIPKVSEKKEYSEDDIEFDTFSIYEELTGLKAPEDITPEQVRTLIENANGSGGVSYTELVSELAKHFEEPSVIEFKEILTARNLTFLNGILEENGTITLSSGKVLHRHPLCIIVATSNTTYSDVLEPDASLMQRFMYNCRRVDTPEESEVQIRLKQVLEESYPEIAELNSLVAEICKVNTLLENFAQQQQARNVAFGLRFCVSVALNYAEMYEEDNEVHLSEAIIEALPAAVSITNSAEVEDFIELIDNYQPAQQSFTIRKKED